MTTPRTELDTRFSDPAAQPTSWEDTLEAIRQAEIWAQKWDRRWQYEVSQDGFRHAVGTALVFAVRPTKVLAFTKGGFSHTRHRF